MSERLCLGVLRIDDVEFAVADSDLQEVVLAPARYAGLPDAASFVLGAMPFHGAAIPVLDLMGVLHPGRPGGARARRLVAVLRCGSGQLGIPVDAIVRVARPDREALSPMESAAPGESPVLREAFLDGEMVVPRLDVERLAALPGARVAPAAEPAAGAEGAKGEDRLDLALFRVGDLVFGVRLECAARARTVPPPSVDSLGCPALFGFCDLDGHPTPVVNLRGALGLADPAGGGRAERAMVLEQAGTFLNVGITGVLGIESCALRSIRRLEAGEIPECTAIQGAYLSARHGRVLVLDSEGLFSLPALTSLCRRGEVPATEAAVARGPDGAGEGVCESAAAFLVYGVARSTFATPIAQVRAVLRYPEELTRLRGEGAASLGVMTWQGTVIPLVDLGSLIGSPLSPQELSQAKVLVSGSQGSERGFVVSRVESLQNERPKPAPWAATKGETRGRLGQKVPFVDRMIPVRGEDRRRNAGVLDLTLVEN